MDEGNENLVYPSPWDFKRSLTCHKILLHGTSGFIFHPKEGVPRIFIALKIHRLCRVRTRDLWVQWQTTIPPRRLNNRSTGIWPTCIFCQVINRCDDPGGRAVYGVGLRPLGCWDRGFVRIQRSPTVSLIVCVIKKPQYRGGQGPNIGCSATCNNNNNININNPYKKLPY
jgi:hypothetical protein